MGIGWRELIIILLIALLVFGAKKLRNIGSDLGAAVRGFKKAVNDGDTEESTKQLKHEEGDADFDSAPDTKRNADAKDPGNRNA
jgi:sec-independent protein translocase protein TatA